MVSDMGMVWAVVAAGCSSFGQAPCRSFQMTPAEVWAQGYGARPHSPALVHVKRPRTTAHIRETEQRGLRHFRYIAHCLPPCSPGGADFVPLVQP